MSTKDLYSVATLLPYGAAGGFLGTMAGILMQQPDPASTYGLFGAVVGLVVWGVKSIDEDEAKKRAAAAENERWLARMNEKKDGPP